VDLGLVGKVALVTGSSRGIGRGIATRLVAEGADVVFCARGSEALDEAVAAANGPGRAHGVVADVATEEGAAAVVDGAVSVFGGLDIVVNNVGGSGASTFDGLDTEDLDAVLRKNVVPSVLVSRAALPVLRARGGGVITMVASIFGRELGGGPGYNLAKAAEISLAKTMARDLAKDSIRVFSVSPGSVLFPGGSWERRQREDPEGITAFVQREIPWGRFGTVAEIAAAGKPAIFIPFPFAADDHQTRNAQALASNGAAMVIAEKDLSAISASLPPPTSPPASAREYCAPGIPC